MYVTLYESKEDDYIPVETGVIRVLSAALLFQVL
jgi:hypothetical protein